MVLRRFEMSRLYWLQEVFVSRRGQDVIRKHGQGWGGKKKRHDWAYNDATSRATWSHSTILRFHHEGESVEAFFVGILSNKQIRFLPPWGLV